jgi:hypothetical protein
MIPQKMAKAAIASSVEITLCRIFSLLDIKSITYESLDLIRERLTCAGPRKKPEDPQRLLHYATMSYGISPF